MARGPRRGPFRGPQPTRARFVAAAAGTTALFLDWFVPFEVPAAHQIEPGLSAAWTQYHTGFLTPPVPSMASWHQPYAEPVRSKPVPVREGTSVRDIREPSPFAFAGWYRPFGEPVRDKPRPVREGDYEADWKGGIPAIDVIYAPFAEPVRQKAGLHASLQQYLVYRDGNPQFLVPIYQPLYEPVRVEPGLSAAWTQYHTGFLTPAVPDFRSYLPLSEPVRVKPQINRGPEFRTDWKWAAPTVVTVYNWFSPLSEPVIPEPGLGAAWQQVSTVGTAVAFTYNWFAWLSEPVRQEPGLSAAWTQYHTGFVTPAPSFTDLRNFWYQPLGEPVRSKQDIRWREPFTTDWRWIPPNVTLVNYWLSPFGEPVRSKPVPVREGIFTTDWKWSAPVVAINYWFSGLSEPVWPKPGLHASRQQFLTIDWKWTPPSFPGAWWRPFAEPVRAKQDIRWREPFTTDWKWTQPSTQTFGWYQWWREPVWPKPGLHAARQQFFTTDWQWRAPVQVGWYQWLREPVRQKPGLHASRQPFFQMDWKWSPPIVVTISYTLNANESGDSGRLYYASMDIVTGAYVTITEEEVGNMAVVTITARSE